MLNQLGSQKDITVHITKTYVKLIIGLTSAHYSILQSHRAFQKAVRTFVDATLYPDAQAVQDKGKKPSQKVFDEIARLNVHAIRLGPGEHLKGRELFNGTVKPEEVRHVFLEGCNCFRQVC